MARDSLGFGKPGTEDVVPCHLPVETGIKGLIKTCLGVPLLDELSKVAYFLGEQNIHIRRAGAPGLLVRPQFLSERNSASNYWQHLLPGAAERRPPSLLGRPAAAAIALLGRRCCPHHLPGSRPPQSAFLPPGAPLPPPRPQRHEPSRTWDVAARPRPNGPRVPPPGRLHASHSDASQSRASPPQS